MKAILSKAGLLTAMAVLGLGAPASASTLDVKVPFPFVVHGKTLPAGTYRLDTENNVVFLRGEKGNHEGLFFVASPAGGHDPAGRRPALTFTKVENQYRLNTIWESGKEGEQVRR